MAVIASWRAHRARAESLSAPFPAGRAARRVVGALLVLFGMATAGAETLSGHVSEVIDGDTLRVVLLKRGPVLVRLAWVDAPDRLPGAW